MILIGIDPGYERLGIAVLERPEKSTSRSSKEKLVYSDCFKTSAQLPFKERLLLVGQEFERLIDMYKPEVFAVETLFFTNNQKTAMNVAEVRGALLYIAQKRGLVIHEFNPVEVKVAVAGYGKGDKKQVQQMVHHLVTIEKEIAHDDEYDAIAIALTASAVIKK